uniref:Uncharacterized protein n=1 Tax=Anguilla anguilla TaxID=7936 RepID=A0A0E9S2P1_ANGAN
MCLCGMSTELEPGCLKNWSGYASMSQPAYFPLRPTVTDVVDHSRQSRSRQCCPDSFIMLRCLQS